MFKACFLGKSESNLIELIGFTNRFQGLVLRMLGLGACMHIEKSAYNLSIYHENERERERERESAKFHYTIWTVRAT